MLRQVAEEEATFLGLLVDLAESAEQVSARSSSGTTHHGRVVAVGRDFLLMRGLAGRPVFIPLERLVTLRLQPGARARDIAGSRPAPINATFAAILAGVAPERPRVQVGTVLEALTGELRSVGLDVLTLRFDGGGPPLVHLPLSAVCELTLLDDVTP